MGKSPQVRAADPPAVSGNMTVLVGPVIQAGQFLSDPLNVTGTLQTIGMPDDWTPALLTFQVSPDSGVTWFDLVNNDTSEVMFNIVPGSMIMVDPGSPLANKSYIKFRSGRRDYPVDQAAERTFTLGVV